MHPKTEPLAGGERPAAIRRIADSVARLIDPPLGALVQTVREVEAGVDEKRCALAREQATVREEGFEAATRLALSVADDPVRRVGYYQQLMQEDAK